VSARLKRQPAGTLEAWACAPMRNGFEVTQWLG
jgi:hypothetical protein